MHLLPPSLDPSFSCLLPLLCRCCCHTHILLQLLYSLNLSLVWIHKSYFLQLLRVYSYDFRKILYTCNQDAVGGGWFEMASWVTGDPPPKYCRSGVVYVVRARLELTDQIHSDGHISGVWTKPVYFLLLTTHETKQVKLYDD
jgi:hypothetical protein